MLRYPDQLWSVNISFLRCIPVLRKFHYTILGVPDTFQRISATEELLQIILQNEIAIYSIQVCCAFLPHFCQFGCTDSGGWSKGVIYKDVILEVRFPQWIKPSCNSINLRVRRETQLHFFSILTNLGSIKMKDDHCNLFSLVQLVRQLKLLIDVCLHHNVK